MLSKLDESASKKNAQSGQSPEEAIEASAAIAYIAGADTTLSSIQAFFMAMANNPKAQKAAQKELDDVVGGSRLPTFSDKDDLPFVTAITKEMLRWHNVTPMGVAHSLIEDDEYRGYALRKGTVVMGNTWQILHDSAIYPNPLAFNPWRWLIETPEGLKFNSAVPDPSIAAFGFGRRICPGRHFASSSLFIIVATVLACFDIGPLDAQGKPTERVDEAFTTDSLISFPLPFNVSISPRSEKVGELIKELEQ